MNKKLLIILAVLCSSVSVAFAQGLRDVKINEILVKNVDSYADSYGHKVGWIELQNTGYSNVNVAGAFLRLVQGDSVYTYRIPKNDVRTNVAPQGFLIFFADSSSNKGTFHTSFRLDVYDSLRWEKLVGQMDRIELLDQSGRVVVDVMEYDMNTQIPDVSYGRHLNYETGEYHNQLLSHVTPMQLNETIEPKPKGEVFREQDPAGIAMAVTAMSVVFTALILLYAVFKNVGKFMQRGAVKKEKVIAAEHPTAKIDDKDEASGETIAAIAVALRFYEEDLHDIESTVITINKVARAYSPWSSKIYSLRQIPNKKTW